MITNFRDFEAVYFREHKTSDDLEYEEVKNLQDIVASWGEEEMEPAISTMEDHYGLVIPVDFMREVLKNDVELALENYTNGISDTSIREVLCDAVLRKMNVRSWPMNLEGEDVFKNFIKELDGKSKLYGVGFSD